MDYVLLPWDIKIACGLFRARECRQLALNYIRAHLIAQTYNNVAKELTSSNLMKVILCILENNQLDHNVESIIISIIHTISCCDKDISYPLFECHDIIDLLASHITDEKTYVVTGAVCMTLTNLIVDDIAISNFQIEKIIYSIENIIDSIQDDLALAGIMALMRQLVEKQLSASLLQPVLNIIHSCKKKTTDLDVMHSTVACMFYVTYYDISVAIDNEFIPYLVQAIDVSDPDSDIVINSLLTLINISSGPHSNMHKIIDANGLTGLYRIASSTKSPIVLKNIVRLYTNITGNGTHIDAILKNKCLEIVQICIESTDERVLKETIRLIENLIQTGNPECLSIAKDKAVFESFTMLYSNTDYNGELRKIAYRAYKQLHTCNPYDLYSIANTK